MSHLFITRGNIAHLACDAWLLSTGPERFLSSVWQRSISPEEFELWQQFHRGRGQRLTDERRVAPLDPEPAMYQSRAWLTDVGGWAGKPVEWYLEGVRQFFDAVEAWFGASYTPLHRRERPLVALPLVGTGYGGASQIKGTITRRLISMLLEQAGRRPFDIVLVTFNDAALAAAQQTRLELLDDNPTHVWADLDAHRLEHVEELAARARRGELVLFLGAGVSAGAGLPTWAELLANLATSAGIAESEQLLLGRMDMLDQARILAIRLEARERRIGEAVRDQLQQTHYALAHSLLASLPVNEVATTNYDQLFETASRDVERPASVLPYAPDRGRDRWLLKMHGCVSQPDDIVLTRSDYLRYAERRAALAGIVQALLITRHMLFVGFSLNDDNFHRIADEVRRALSAAQGISNFGTSLVLGRDSLLEELWLPDIRCLPMSDRPKGEDLPGDARRLEIFLDALLALSTESTAHLMDETFDAVLDDGERELRRRLLELQRGLPDDVRRTGAWTEVEALLERLGQRKR